MLKSRTLIIFTSFSFLIFAICCKGDENELRYHELREIVETNSISDGERVLLKSALGNAVVVLQNQTLDPESMDFSLYILEEGRDIDYASPTIAKKNVSIIEFSFFRIPWSAAEKGKGYLYPKESPFDETSPSDLQIFRQGTDGVNVPIQHY